MRGQILKIRLAVSLWAISTAFCLAQERVDFFQETQRRPLWMVTPNGNWILAEYGAGRPDVDLNLSKGNGWKAQDRIRYSKGAVMDFNVTSDPSQNTSARALIVKDLENIEESVSAQRGLISIHTQYFGPLGWYWLQEGQFRDYGLNTEDAVVISISNICIVNGVFAACGENMVLHEGESITITFDGGKTMSLVFPVDLTIPDLSGLLFYIDAHGKLFWDYDFKRPLREGERLLEFVLRW